jgi:hypothetical protein
MSLLLSQLGGGGGNVGNSNGVATAAAVAGAAGTGTSAGIATALAVGAGTFESVGSSAGAASVTSVSLTLATRAGSSNGVATAAAVGVSNASSVGDSTGVATVNGIASDPVGISITNATFLYNETDQASYTFTAAFIGAAAADRDVILCISTAGSSAPGFTSATIGGVTAPIIANTTGTNVRLVMCLLRVPSGTNADIVITFSGATPVRGVVDVYRMVGAVDGVVTDFEQPAGGGDAARSNTIDIEAEGAVLSTMVGTGASVAWTNSTEFSDQVPTSGYNISSAVYVATAAETGRVITATSGRAVVSAAFRPQPINVGASAGVATASGAGRAVIDEPGTSAGVATVVGVGAGPFDPLLKAAGLSAGRATVFGTRQGFSYPMGLSAGKATANAYPAGYFTRLRLGAIVIPNLKYGPSQVTRAYYNRQLIFQHVVSASGAGLSAGKATPVGVGDFTVGAAQPSLVASGATTGGAAASQTIAAQSFGALPPGGDRRIMVLVVGAQQQIPNHVASLQPISASLAGQAMTKVASGLNAAGPGGASIAIFVLELNTSTTGDIVLSYNLAATGIPWALFRVKIFGTGDGYIDSDCVPGIDPANMTLITNKGSAVIGGCMMKGAGSPPVANWTGIDLNSVVGNALSVAFKVVQVESSAYAVQSDSVSAPNRIASAVVSIGP